MTRRGRPLDRTALLLVLPLVAVLLLLTPACGGQDNGRRTKLERSIAQGDKTICGTSCKTFHATTGTCAKSSTLVGTHRFYRCRIDYDNGGPPDRVCVALKGSKAIFRPLSTCKR